MDNSNLNHKIPLSKKISNPNTFHFSPLYYFEKEDTRKRQYHGYSSSPMIEKEYQQISRENLLKKEKTIINLTSEKLKKEYTNKISYLNSGIKNIVILSIFLIFNTFLELKFLGPSETNMAILILCFISSTFCFMLLINIRGKALIDSYGYISFYIISIVESILLLFLFILKMINFIVTFNNLNANGKCRNKYKCPNYFIYLSILITNLIMFLGFLLCGKSIFILFLDGFNIFFLKKKTLFQKQIDLDEKERREKDRKIEFTDDTNESINNSFYQLNSKDELKID